MKVVDSLRAVNAYPVPLAALESIAIRRGLVLDDEMSLDLISSVGYRLAESDLRMWLASAPDISQGGQSYSLSAEQRLALTAAARRTYADIAGDEERRAMGGRYGYKGDRL